MIPDAREHAANLGAMRQMTASFVESPGLHQRANGNVESSLTLTAVLDASREKVEQLLGNADGMVSRLTIHLTPFALGPIIGQQLVQSPGLLQRRCHRRLQLVPVLAVCHDRESGPHGVHAALGPRHLRLDGRRRRLFDRRLVRPSARRKGD